MKEYQRRNNIAKAELFDGIEWSSIQDMLQGMTGVFISSANINPSNPSRSSITIRTPLGFRIARFNDWVVVDAKHIFVMDGDDFHEEYMDLAPND